MTGTDRGPAEPDLLAGLRDGSYLNQQKFPPLRFVLPGIIPEGLTLLAGPPKVGKSAFVRAVGVGAAGGGKVLGHLQVAGRPVLYLALEDSDRRLQERCRALLGQSPIPAAFEYLTRVTPGAALATIDAWMAQHRREKPLVLLDTLGKVMPPASQGESAYQRDYRIGSALKALADADPGAALVVNHHDRKAPSEDFVERVSGTNGLVGSADTIIVVSRRRGERDGLLYVTGRDVSEGAYGVTYDGPRGLWTLKGSSLTAALAAANRMRATAGVGDRLADVIRWVCSHPGVGPSEVAAALDMTPKAASTYLGRAVYGKRLVRPARGIYVPVGSVGNGNPPTQHPTHPTQSHEAEMAP